MIWDVNSYLGGAAERALLGADGEGVLLRPERIVKVQRLRQPDHSAPLVHRKVPGLESGTGFVRSAKKCISQPLINNVHKTFH